MGRLGLSLWHGIRCVLEDGGQVEEVLLAQMNKAEVVFLTQNLKRSTLICGPNDPSVFPFHVNGNIKPAPIHQRSHQVPLLQPV